MEYKLPVPTIMVCLQTCIQTTRSIIFQQSQTIFMNTTTNSFSSALVDETPTLTAYIVHITLTQPYTKLKYPPTHQLLHQYITLTLVPTEISTMFFHFVSSFTHANALASYTQIQPLLKSSSLKQGIFTIIVVNPHKLHLYALLYIRVTSEHLIPQLIL